MRVAGNTSPLWPDTPITFPALVHDHIKLNSTRSTIRRPCLVGNRVSTSHRRGRRVCIAAGRSLQSKATSEGSAWIPSGALLATGGALPGLLLASNWQHVSVCGSSPFQKLLKRASEQSRLACIHSSGLLVQVADMGPAYQTVALAAVDILFISTATAFLSTGSQFGHQRYENTPDFPGGCECRYFVN